MINTTNLFTSLHDAGPPSIPTVDNVKYSVVDSTTGRFIFLASSSGTFGTEVTISASVAGDSGSVVVTDNSIVVTGLSYGESHTVSVVATSDVCPGVLNNSIDVPVSFNIKSEWTNKLMGVCIYASVCLGAHAQARYTVVCLCVSVCQSVCLYRLLQLLKDQSSVSNKSFYRLLFNLWKQCFVLPSFAYLECHCSLFRRVRRKTCPWSVATLLSS